jgi:acetyl esterase/lipase
MIATAAHRGLILSVTLAAPLAAQNMRPADVNGLPASTPALIQSYGADSLQFGELRLPPGPGPFPVAVVIHGGCWTRGFATLRNTAALASALTERGIATWNIECRQVGDPGGGWPGTFQDWGAGFDHLRKLANTQPIDTSRAFVLGHSAGAHAALFVAARPRLAASSPIRGSDPLGAAAAVAIDGPGDIVSIVGRDARICGRPVIVPLMGGTPDSLPARYNHASPFEVLPIGVPQYLVASVVLTVEEANRYRDRATAAGDVIEVLAPADGGHFDIIAPGSAVWPGVEAFIVENLLNRSQRSRLPPDVRLPSASGAHRNRASRYEAGFTPFRTQATRSSNACIWMSAKPSGWRSGVSSQWANAGTTRST